MENFLIHLNEMAKILCFTGDKAIRHTHDWVYERGFRQFKRGGYYVREDFYDLLRKESEKCISAKEDSTITSRGKYVLETSPLKSKNTVRGLLSSKMQESMQTA